MQRFVHGSGHGTGDKMDRRNQHFLFDGDYELTMGAWEAIMLAAEQKLDGVFDHR
jgi:transketolase N-terminal domain/subunit